MTQEELEDIGIKGQRLKLALLLRSKLVDILSILMITIYAILMFLYLAFEDMLFPNDEHLLTFLAIELTILLCFVLDICLNVVAYWRLYLRYLWNLFDILIVTLCCIFVLVDIQSQSESIRHFLKIRAIFRLLRIFLLVRKLNALRTITDSERRRRMAVTVKSNGGYDVKSPLERVLETLTKLRERVEPSEKAVISELAYCIRVISSNQLYEAELIVKGRRSVVLVNGNNPDKSENTVS
jgi:Ion transport protein